MLIVADEDVIEWRRIGSKWTSVPASIGKCHLGTSNQVLKRPKPSLNGERQRWIPQKDDDVDSCPDLESDSDGEDMKVVRKRHGIALYLHVFSY